MSPGKPASKPRTETADRALGRLASLVIEDGRRWGDPTVAHGFQWDDALAILSAHDETPNHFLTRPRGASKTSDVGGMSLAAALEQAPDGAAMYALAADKDQARLLLDSIGGFVRRTPGLGDEVDVQSYRAVVRSSGVALTVLAADAAGTHGLRPWWAVADEIVQWGSGAGPTGVWEAIYSAMVKMAGARLVVISTAGDPSHWSARLLETARVSPRWRVAELPGPCPWVDAAALDEQRLVLLPSAFARLHLNQWTASEDRLTSMDDVRRCVGHSGPLLPVVGHRYVTALDVGLKNDATVVTVAHAERLEGESVRVVVDRQQVWQGSKVSPVSLVEVEAWISHAVRAYPGPLVFDPYQAAHLSQRLRRLGVRCVEFTFGVSSVGRLAVTLYRLLRDGLLDLPDDDALIDELAHVRIVERGAGQYRIDHDSGRHDDRAISLALAAHHLVESGAGQAGRLRFAGNEGWTPDREGRPVVVPGLEGMAEYLGGRS